MNSIHNTTELRAETYPALSDFIVDRPLVAQNMSPTLVFVVTSLLDEQKTSGANPEDIRRLETDALDMLAEKHVLDYGDYPEWYIPPTIDMPDIPVTKESDQNRRSRERKQAVVAVALGAVGMTWLWVTGKPKN